MFAEIISKRIMSSIGNLTPSASKTFDISYLPQWLQIGTVTDSATFTGVTVISGGRTLISISNNAQWVAISKMETSPLAAGAITTIAKRVLLSDGRIEAQTTITLVNSSAEASAVYANSNGKSVNKAVRTLAVTPVTANGNLTFSNFDYLLFLPANVSRATVYYENGFSEDLTTDELIGIFMQNNVAEASGLVNGFVAVEGYRAPAGFKISSITLYATGSNIDVVVSSWTTL